MFALLLFLKQSYMSISKTLSKNRSQPNSKLLPKIPLQCLGCGGWCFYEHQFRTSTHAAYNLRISSSLDSTRTLQTLTNSAGRAGTAAVVRPRRPGWARPRRTRPRCGWPGAPARCRRRSAPRRRGCRGPGSCRGRGRGRSRGRRAGAGRWGSRWGSGCCSSRRSSGRKRSVEMCSRLGLGDGLR